MVAGVGGEVGERPEPRPGGFGGVSGLDEQWPGVVLGGFDGAGGDGPQTCECGDGGPEAEPQDGDEGLAGEAEVDGWRLVGARSR